MRNPSYLILSRHNIYYFRWPLPRQIRQQGKTPYVKISLQTREPKEALRLATLLQDHVFNLLKQDWVLMMDYSEIKAMVEDHFGKILEERRRDIDKNGPLLPFPMARARRLIKAIDDSVEGTAEYSVMEPDDQDLAQIIQDYELDLTKSDKDRKQLKGMYWMAAKAMMQEVIAYSNSQEKFNFGGSSGMAAVGYKVAKPENKLERVIAKHTAEMNKAQVWGVKSVGEREDAFNYLCGMLGHDYDMMRFDIPTAREVKDILMQTPANRNKVKATRDLPWREQLKVEGVKKLSVGSINKYLQCYSSLCLWAARNGYVDKNPFEGLSLKGEGQKRDYFRPDQVKVLLAEIDKGKTGLLGTDMKYWGTLIALYTGARLNEVASLTPNDIKQDKKSGIWYFDINDEEEKKRLKTDAATRLVPVHSELKRLGFLEYVEQEQKKGGGGLRLLPDLTYSKKEGWGRKLGRWFNTTFLKKLGLKKPTTSFHSLRHTVITNLRRAGVDNHNVRGLVGHEPDGVTEETYTHDLGLAQLQRDIEHLNYRAEEE